MVRAKEHLDTLRAEAGVFSRKHEAEFHSAASQLNGKEAWIV